ncbi:MAG: hypothetical protein ACI8R4_003363 [Paracoccaceae bacterium]|jgi:hypothetical protein
MERRLSAILVADMFVIQDEITRDISLALDVQVVSGFAWRSIFEDAGDL